MKEINSLNKERKAQGSGHWCLSRLRIYDTYLILNCGGEMDKALPTLKNYFNEINNIAINGGAIAEPSRLKLDSSYLYITGLAGFSTQAGWMLVGMLVKDGWFVQKFQYEILNGKQQPMIDMMR